MHAQTYWNILEKVKGSELRLTKLDQEIYEHFQKDFPEVDVSKIIDEDAMKSKAGKERWRKFMQAYEKKVSWLLRCGYGITILMPWYSNAVDS